MRYVGLDVHAKQSTYCVLDANGKKITTRTLHGSWIKLLSALGKVKRPFAICFEASTGYGYLHDKLKLMASRVSVAHPGHLRLIFRSKRKNDRVDAEKLAKLLFLDEVPEVYVPGVDIRGWRGLIEYRHRAMGERTRVKNQLRALLRGQGIASPKGLWTKRGIAWLQEQTLATEFDMVRRDLLLERLASHSAMLKKLEKTLNRYGRAHPGVVLLRTIDGVGPRTAEAVVAYIDDPSRFGRVKKIGSYFGLIPTQDASAGKNRLGHITRQGPPTVRRLLTEAAWQGVRRSKRIRAYYEQIRKEDPERKKIAITATAHHLLRVMITMLKTGEVWRGDVAA